MAELGPFRVGDRPTEMLTFTIDRPGDADPLGDFTAATVRMIEPDGNAVPWAGNILGSEVRSTFPAAFTKTGQYKIRVELTGPAGASERTSWAHFWVRPAL